MPENNAGSITEILKWGWVGMCGITNWVCKRLVGYVDQIKEDLSDHVLDDLKSHDDYVHKDDWQEMKANLTSRFDKLDENDKDIAHKIDSLLERVSIGASRDELEALKDQLHGRINELERSKADK